MRLISLNVGLPRELSWKGESVISGIVKAPIGGRVPLRTLNLDGDRQADLSVHGGPEKAVYVYPSEHYEYWRSELGDPHLNWGMFGENFTTEGLSEDGVNIGDCFRIGSAEVMVTQPRMPCYKLAMKFGRDDMIKRFLASGRTGFYFSVLSEGEVGAGDDITLTHRDENDLSVAEITRLYSRDKHDLEATRRAVNVEALPENWKVYFQRRLG